jgi:tetratricopeptide (TPR) repeat protein
MPITIKSTLPLYLVFVATLAGADPVANVQELRTLPKFCWGTQQIRTVSKDPKPIDEYIKRYGASYNHFHHFCWGLNGMHIAARMVDRNLRIAKLRAAVSDFDYMLANSEPAFVFLPLVHVARATALRDMGQPPAAVGSLLNAIKLKPDYARAYLMLADIMVTQNNIDDAIKILKRGLSKCKGGGAVAIKKRLASLGVDS